MILHKDVVVIGAGPAGLAAAIEAAKAGADTLLVDMNLRPGGQLFKQIHKFFGSSAHRSGTRGIDIGKALLQEAETAGVTLWLKSTVVGLFPGYKVSIQRGSDHEIPSLVTVQAGKIIVATGASENVVRFEGWTLPGVMGAGAAQTMVNVNHVKPGKKVVMLGSGNVGLIVSYQLMQAGCEVVALVEAAPKIGGYAVHAAKIRRAGVPVYTGHTIVRAVAGSDGCVQKVVIAAVDEKFQPAAGTEAVLEADCVAIGAGLKPSAELLRLLQCRFTFSAVFGGYIPLHNENMETSLCGIYVAGDATGVEEANTALEEGRLAGVSAAEALGYLPPDRTDAHRAAIRARLQSLRMGPFGERRQKAADDIVSLYHAAIGAPADEILPPKPAEAI